MRWFVFTSVLKRVLGESTPGRVSGLMNMGGKMQLRETRSTSRIGYVMQKLSRLAVRPWSGK